MTYPRLLNAPTVIYVLLIVAVNFGSWVIAQ